MTRTSPYRINRGVLYGFFGVSLFSSLLMCPFQRTKKRRAFSEIVQITVERVGTKARPCYRRVLPDVKRSHGMSVHVFADPLNRRDRNRVRSPPDPRLDRILCER